MECRLEEVLLSYLYDMTSMRRIKSPSLRWGGGGGMQKAETFFRHRKTKHVESISYILGMCMKKINTGGLSRKLRMLRFLALLQHR